ncbi:MAG: hypothetical protein JW839_12300 [Candidatus Lokiarchaeota archaeon]|nr:hypothetical protein [Candidatus Lokiarchaeota archaeon]
MTILEHFQKAKEVWTNKKVTIGDIPAGIKKNEAFHAAIHATNGPASRVIFMRPVTEEIGDIAIYLNKNNQFYQVESTERGVEITVWGNQEIADKIDGIIDEYKKKTLAFVTKVLSKQDKKDDVIRTITIEERIDEAINNAMNKEINRIVYFSIGKIREFAANIPLLMNASGFNLLQLSMNKWMTTADQLRQKPEEPFPEDKVKAFCADALKWKKFVIEFLDGPAW